MQLDLPSIDADFQSSEFVADPYPTLTAIQDMGPLVFHVGLESYLVTRWDDCIKVLRNHDTFIADADFRTRFNGGESLVSYDDERHAKLRAVWAKAFERVSIAGHRGLVAE